MQHQSKSIDINAGKGFRKHQADMASLAIKTVADDAPKSVIAISVTPGGGKTGCASILIHELFRLGFVDQVLWFAPALALVSQTIESFCNNKMFNPSGYQIESAGNGPLYTPPQIGCVATFAELSGVKLNLFLQAMKGRRTLVIFDEAHQLSKDDEGESKVWAKACEAIAAQATVTLVMTGTPERHDGKPIALMKYKRDISSNRSVTDPDITYGLRQAIMDAAVAQPEFIMTDGLVEYAVNGQLFKGELSNDDAEKERHLRVALGRPEFVHSILDQAIAHWRNHAQTAYRSRMIVMAEDQKNARAIAEYLVKKYKMKVTLALEGEANSQQELENFRLHASADVLVTCRMASLGFDVPDLTHCVYLRTWRSKPEFQQSIARAMRINYKCKITPTSQKAYIFVPNDAQAVRLVEELRLETELGIQDRKSQNSGQSPPPPPRSESNIQAISCTPTNVSMATLDRNFSSDDTWKIEAVRAAYANPAIPEDLCLSIHARYPQDYPRVIHGPNTPDGRKKELRSKNAAAVAELGALQSATAERDKESCFKDINARLKGALGKSPEEMTEDELTSRLSMVRDWVRKERQSLSLNGAAHRAR